MTRAAGVTARRTADVSRECQRLRSLMPTDNGVTVFDAETQETSYGILVEDGLPFIFDTHRKDGRFVATVEALTEVVRPVPVKPRELESFVRVAERRGVLALPYTGCFFKGNLHVYSFSGPVRGLDLSTLGGDVRDAEATLRDRFATLWKQAPGRIRKAQHDLITGRRRARYGADLEVLKNDARQVDGWVRRSRFER